MTTRGGRQVIPRPPSARAGEDAPWAALEASQRRGLGLEHVRGAVDRLSRAHASDAAAGPATPGPGHSAAPTSFDGFPDPGASAAVLVPLFEEDGEVRVVLTRRAGHLRTHTGEVSFPGGRLEPGESPETGAMREALEEIGLDPSGVTVVGRLTVLSTFSSAAVITPVVGVLDHRPEMVPNPHEVAHVFDVSLAELADPGVFREERWRIPGRPRTATSDDGGWFPVWFFEFPDDTIWGATARILVELLRLVLDV
ncbi:MAG: NUDIX hydrolase [Acidimicrobiales bacterium]